MRYVVILLLGLTACQTSILSSDENHIALQQHRFTEAGAGQVASDHCANFGKQPELVAAQPIGANGMNVVYRFDCR